jgi:hypothetical protein
LADVAAICFGLCATPPMFEDLTLDELRDLLQQLRTKQAETERLIREVIDRIVQMTPT